MKILFLSNYYPPFEIGGYEQLCRDVAVRLTNRGHTTAVLTSDRGATKGSETDEPGVHRLLRIQPQYDACLSPAAQFVLTRRRAENQNRHWLRELTAHVRPDVAFIWNLEGLPHELALDAESLLGGAVAYWLASHSPAEPDLFWRYWTQPPGKRSALKGIKSMVGRLALAQMRREGKPVQPKMRHVAVVSEYLRRRGVAQGTLPEHAEVIYNGIEVETFYRPVPHPHTTPPINLLVAGRVSPDKGVHVAVNAIAQLAQVRPQRDFRLNIVGSGPHDYREQLSRLTLSNQIGDLVAFRGWISREQVPSLMHTCQILLLPTVCEEAFARVALEAMAAGLAVVGTLTGGTGELLVDGCNGLTCATGDSDDLARQINRLLDDPHLRQRLAQRGQETVLAHYRLERMVREVERLLERAVGESSRRLPRRE